MNAVFTIAAKNYLANAIALGRSVKLFSEGLEFYIVLVDEWDDPDQPTLVPFNVLEARELGVEGFDRMVFMYDVVELSTALKPFVFLKLLKQFEKVIYMDPDTLVMDSRFDDVIDKLDQYSFVLTPHIADMNVESVDEIEGHILRAGIFNLGFLGVRNSEDSVDFIKWWAKRLKTECIRDSGLFVDQKWINYLPVYNDNYYICRDKGYDLADWNLHERSIVYENDKYMVLDSLGFVSVVFWHFSKYKDQAPIDYLKTIGVLGRKEQKEIETLCEIIDAYKTMLVECGYDYWHGREYSYNSFSNNKTISILHRRIYRGLVKKGRIEILDKPFVENSPFFQILKKIGVSPRDDYRVDSGVRFNESAGTKKKYVAVLNVIIRIIGIERFDRLRNKLLSTLSTDNMVDIWVDQIIKKGMK